MASSFGKMPTTSVLRLISPFNRSMKRPESQTGSYACSANMPVLRNLALKAKDLVGEDNLAVPLTSIVELENVGIVLPFS